jgi:hypothetical protein
VGVLELLWLLLTSVLAWVRPRHDLMLENLLLRHQLTVLTRSTRPDRVPAFASGTSSSGCWHDDGVPAGVST